LFSVYVNDMPSLPRHTKLALYVDGMTIMGTLLQPTLLIEYLKNNLDRLEHWSVAIKVSNSTGLLH
jgi:hypothetical protein